MSPATLAALVNAGITTLEALNAARAESKGMAISLDLKRRLRAQMTFLADDLDQDIKDELKRRGEQP